MAIVASNSRLCDAAIPKRLSSRQVPVTVAQCYVAFVLKLMEADNWGLTAGRVLA
jgi:hypothetical protein